MTAKALRDEMHKMIDSMDESKLKLAYSRLMDDEKIVGRRSDGSPISIADLKKGIEQSDKDLADGKYKNVSDARKATLNW